MCDLEEFQFSCGHNTFRLKSYCHFARNDPNHQCFGVKQLRDSWPQHQPCEPCQQANQLKQAQMAQVHQGSHQEGQQGGQAGQQGEQQGAQQGEHQGEQQDDTQMQL